VADKIRVGVLGLSHDHIWDNLRALQESEGGELVAAADPHPELREQARKAGVEKVYDSPALLLDAEKLDAVYVYGDNRGGVDATLEAVRRGLHVMIEKPMASTYAGASKMRGAAAAAGVQLMVNWPIMWWAPLQQAFQLIGEGRIGELWQVHYRSAHNGPRELGCSPFFAEWLYDPERNGAGALMDYCCYGAAMTCALLGLPSRVTGVSARLRKRDLPAEDNAVLIMQHARALSTTVASWTQVGHMTSYVPTFYGSEGTILIQGGKLHLADHQNDNGVELDTPAPAPHLRNSAEFFFHHIRSGEPITGLCGPDVGVMAQEVLEAGLISAAEGGSVSLPLPAETLKM
jgi:predicted dehydrogenase